MHLLNSMGHQDLTLLYVRRELILYCSPNCVFTIIPTQITTINWECHPTLCPNRLNKYHPQNTNDLCKKKDQQNFDDVTRHIGQVTIGSKKNPICIPGNSSITVPGHTTKVHPKAVCLVEQAEHHNLPQGIVVNRCVATVKSRSVPVILINTNKQNVWLRQPLLAAELYTAEYHPIEHRVDMEVEGDVAKVSFLPVVPNTIRVQVEQVEATSTDTATPDPQEKLVFGPRPDTQSARF